MDYYLKHMEIESKIRQQMNEVWVSGVVFGYMHGMGAPHDRNSAPKCLSLTGTKPFIMGPNYILAHAVYCQALQRKFSSEEFYIQYFFF